MSEKNQSKNENYKQKKKEKEMREYEINREMLEKKRKKESEAEKAEREKLLKEKIQIKQMKLGLADAKNANEEKKETIILTKNEKFKNFIYYYKWTIVIIATLLIIVGVSVYEQVTKIVPDGGVLVLAYNPEISNNYVKVEKMLESVGIDYNKDGNIDYYCSYLPQDIETDAQLNEAYAMKFMVELELSDNMLVIADSTDEERMKYDETLADLSEIFPDNKNIKEYGFYLKDTKFAEMLGIKEVSDTMFMGIRKVQNISDKDVMQEKYDIAVEMLGQLIDELSE